MDEDKKNLYLELPNILKAYFLNEKKLNNMGYTVEKFFNANLISFILSTQYNGYNVSDLVIEDENFANARTISAKKSL